MDLNFEDTKHIGDIRAADGRFEEAVGWYTRALEMGINDSSACATLHSNRCACHIKLGNKTEALKDAKAALALRPRWHKTHLRLAQSQELSGELQLALASYERSVELEPSLAGQLKDKMKDLRSKVARTLLHAVLNGGGGAIYSAALHPTLAQLGELATRVVASAHKDGVIRLWSTATGTLLQSLEGHTAAVTSLAWSEDGAMLASGSLDCTARVWHACADNSNAAWKPLQLVSLLQGHTGRVSSVAFSREGACALATCSPDQSVRLWALPSGECLHQLNGHSALVADIALSPSGDLLVSASGDAVFRLWDTRSGQSMQDVGWDSGPVVLCGFIPSAPPAQPLLLTAHAQLVRSEGRVLLWDVLDRAHGWVDGRLSAPAKAIDGLVGRPTSWDAVIDPEGAVVLAVACSDGSVRLWDVTDAPIPLFGFDLQDPAARAAPDLPPWRASAVQAAANAHNLVKFGPDGELLAASGAGNDVSVWSMDSGKEVCSLAGHSGPIRRIVWLGDRELLTASEDGTMRTWRVPKEANAS